jgi:superfamily II RNA helicase
MHPPLTPDATMNDPETLLDRFLEYVASKSIELYPAQEEAILELYEGNNVILNTPTGSGKSLVALAMHFRSLCLGNRSVYTCPIKALVNEKFLSLCSELGAENVGMMTGDATVNRGAPVLCCTAEILANIALSEGSAAKVDDVIMDEFHYYSDPERGVAWQIPLLTLPQSRFLLMSATLGDTRFFENELTRLTHAPTALISHGERPVPLAFSWREIPLGEVIEELDLERRLPVYIVHFTQRSAAETAQNLTSVNFCSKAEKERIQKEIESLPFTSPFGKEIKKLLNHGIGLHHAGLLPRYRILVEKLAQKGLLKVICGTDTLGVGVNVPIRTVLFTQLCKYSGDKTAILTARDFHQISGRAGRRGFDDIGYVIALAPEHVIENLRMESKAGKDGKKKKFVRRKPPERGYVHWDEKTFERLQSAQPEPLESRFKVSHGMVLQVLNRDGDGCRALRDLIKDCHQAQTTKRILQREAFQLFRSLYERGIVEIIPYAERTERKLRVNIELQEDFSLHQTLSLYFLDTLQLLESDDPDYALKVLSLMEAILENPEIILQKQLDRLKSDKMVEMKAAGIEYEERIERLQELEYPKPEREFIYSTFNEFARIHPWVGKENIRPKSIVREMFERYMSFSDYIREYGLMRSEGLLLRHLTSTLQVFTHTLPEGLRDERLDEMHLYLEEMIRQIDSSLLDEWERLRHPEMLIAPENKPEFRPISNDITQPIEHFRKRVRNELFRWIRLIANRDYAEIAETIQMDPFLKRLTTDIKWGDLALEAHLASYYESHAWIRLDPAARAGEHTHWQTDTQPWYIHQTLIDPDEHNDWEIVVSLEVEKCRSTQSVQLTLEWIGPLAERPTDCRW